MSRKLKVAPDRQIVTDGKTFLGGDSFTVADDHPEADRWIAADYVTETGGKKKTPEEASEEEAADHYVARARGLNRT